MPDPGDRQAIIEAFQAWRDGPEPWKRTAYLQQLASASPDTWVDAILSLWSDRLSDDEQEMLAHGIRAAIAASPETRSLETRLAERSRVDPGVASVIARALALPIGGTEPRHVVEVLGAGLLFTTWSRFQMNWRPENGRAQRRDVAVDFWAYDVIQDLITFDHELAWDLFLRYLRYEEDPRLRARAAIEWLEPLTFGHAADFIPLIEAEAPDNPRLREAMRHMSAPSWDPEIERRFTDAMAEPPD